MSSLNSFSQTNPAANINIRFGVESNPDEAAQTLALARRFNLPPAAISADRDLFKTRAATEDTVDIVKAAPKTQGWMADSQQNASVAHDDVGVLSSIESFLSHPLMSIAGSLDKAFKAEGPATGVSRLATGAAYAIGGAPDAVASVPAVVRGAPAALASGAVRMAQGLAGYAQGTQEAGEAWDITAPLQRRIFGGTGEGFFGGVFKGIADGLGRTADSLMPQTGDYVSDQVLGGVSNVPNTALALAGGVSARALGMTVKGASLVGSLVGGVTQGGLSYVQARQQGVAPGQAFLYGNIDAATETAGEFLGEFQFLKGSELGQSVLKRFVRSQVGEQVGEGATTIAQDLSAWAFLPENKDKTIGDFFAALPEHLASTAIQTLVAGGISNVAIAGVEKAANLPARQARLDAARQQQAEAAHTQLQTIFAAALQSKLRERDPQSFHDFMEAQTTDTPLEHTYIDGETLNQALQADPEGAADLLARVPSINAQLAQAIETGGDVRIPTAELATALPGNTLEQGIVDNLRVDPMARSAAESRGEAQAAIEKLQATFVDALGKQAVDSEFTASKDRVTQGFRDQLDSTNRFNGDTNEQYANLLGNFFAVQAGRLGITPEEMATRYPLRIQAKDSARTAPDNRLGQSAPLLNIGLSTAELGDGSELDMQHVLDVVRKHGGEPVASTRQTSDSEPTAVIRLATPLTKEQGDAISRELKQEAIVQNRGTEGELFGDQAENWGPYNPDYFVLEDGTRASEAQLERLNQSSEADLYVHYSDQLVAAAGTSNEALEKNSARLDGTNYNSPYMVVEEPARAAKPASAMTDDELMAELSDWKVDESHGANKSSLATRAKSAVSKLLGSTSGTKQTMFIGGGELSDIVLPEQVEVNGEMRPTRNALGNPIASSQEAVENFWRWFEGSGVVDTEGRPIVMYHGTKSTAMTAFDKSKTAGGTFFFSDDKTIADTYSSYEGRTHAMYLRIPNTIEYDADGRNWTRVVKEHTDIVAVDAARAKYAEDLTAKYDPEVTVSETSVQVDGNYGADYHSFPYRIGDEKFVTYEEAVKAAEAKGPVFKVKQGLYGASEIFATREEAEAAVPRFTEEAKARYYNELKNYASPETMSSAGYLTPEQYTPDKSTDTVAAEHYNDYDAVVIRNVRDDASGGGAPSTVVIVLGDPTAAKSLENQGTFEADNPNFYMQTPVATAAVHNIKTELVKEGINQDGGVRLSGDTYLVMPDDFYQTPWNLPTQRNRALELEARIGHKIEIVTSDDPRWADAPEAVLTKPPVNADGTITLEHFGARGLTETDPTKWGLNAGFLSNAEKASIGSAPGRTYFGIGTGKAGGYINEFSPTTQGYTTTVDAARLYDVSADPQGLRKGNPKWEAAVRDAGFAGYWTSNPELGLVAVVFEKMAVTPMPERAKEFAQGVRGYITFGSDVTAQPSTITLLNSSDLSTFLHESGHFFLEVLSHAAAQPNAPEAIVKDMNATLKWMGVPDHGIWQRMTLEQKREFHEQFARGFEAYLFEGKAPNAEMRGAFQRFRSWLVAVYRGAAERLNVKLNADIRGVFDRLVASADTIEQAQHEADLAPYFDAKPVGMTDVEWQEYQALGLAATAEAIDELQSRSLRDMAFARRAQGRELKRLQKEQAANREAVEEEVSAEINARPVFRALDFVRKGTIDGEDTDGPHHFDVTAFNALYDGFAKEDREAVKQKLGRGLFRKEGGVNPAQVAELFGFNSADELVTAMLAAPNREQEIEAATDLRMLERYGDLTTPGALDAAASEAIHNEVRARFVATELRALDKSLGKPRLMAKAAKSYAEQMIARLKLRDVRPAQYEAAERKAAKAARDAKGDTTLAAIAKRNQLVNLYATRAARTAREEIRVAVDYFRKFARTGTRQNIDPKYLDQIDAMLERFDFRTSSLDEGQTQRRGEKRRAALSAWIEEQREMGYEPIFTGDDLLENENNRKHYRDLTVEEMRGLKDAIANIEHLGRLKRELLKNKEERDLAAAQAKGAAAINENAYKTIEQPLGARTWLDRAKSGVDDFFAWQRKFSSMVREMDGNTDRGVLWSLLSRPMNDASDMEATMTAKATKDLHELFSKLDGEATRKREFEPAIGRAISLETRLSIAMNMGNATNIERVTTGEKWTPEQLRAVLAPLTAEHWQFVQSVWNYIGSYWGEISAKQRRVTGVTPERVETSPVSVRTSDGQDLTLAGGYFPIKYDPDRSSKAEADTAAEVQMQLTRGLYTSAQTRRGHTKARVESTGRAMRYDFGVTFEHIGQVVHDLAWHETLIDLNRLLRSGPIEEAVRDRYGPATIRYMRKALEDIAVGGVAAQNAVERGVNYLRTGATVAGLGWNLMTSLFQPLGLTNSMVRIGPKYVGKGISRVFRDAASLKATSSWVKEQSDFMRLRGQTQMREIAEIRQQFAAKGPIRGTVDQIPGAAPVIDAVDASFFVLIEKAQLIADIPTWVGAYEKAVDQGEQHDRAVSFADQVVRDSQGGGQISDLAAVQRGGPFQKLWTNFYSWFNLAYNQMAESVNDTKRVGASRLPLLAVDFLLIAVVPSLMTSLLRGALAGDDEDKFLKRIGEDQLSGWMGFIFGLRELGAMFGVGSSYSGPAGARFIDSTIKLGKQVQQGEADGAFYKALNSTAGVALHYPSGQVQRTVTGIQALADGKSKNPLVIAVGPPPKRKE